MTTPMIRKTFNEFWENADLEILVPEIYEKIRNAYFRTLEQNINDLVTEREICG